MKFLRRTSAPIKITRALKKHIYSITVLTRKYFPYINLNADKILERMQSKSVEYYIALCAGHTAGFVDIEFKENKEKTAKILGLAVIEEFRGRGVGARLLEKALARARQREAKKVFLLVDAENALAQRLYEKFGFKKKGVLKKRLWGKKILLYSLDLRKKKKK